MCYPIIAEEESIEALKIAQMVDLEENLQKIWQYLLTAKVSRELDEKSTKSFKKLAKKYLLFKQKLFYQTLQNGIVRIPMISERIGILKQVHEQ